MAAADTNVRPGRQPPAANARGARRSRLARLLLQSLELLQLYRKLLLLLASSLMPACIIPIGPDWQDPPGERNAPPYLASASPRGNTQTAMPAPLFSVKVGDVNVNDPLHVRWIFEFPNDPAPFFFDVNPPLSPNGQEVRAATEYIGNCGQITNKTISTHQIMVAISDRPWVQVAIPRGDDVIRTEDGTFPVTVSWTWEQTCEEP